MKKILPLFAFLIFSLISFSQRPQGGYGGGGAKSGMPQITIKGQLLDGESQAPLEFATITISSLKEGKVVTGGLTDAEGKFEFKSRPGRLKAVIEFLSYETLEINPLPFERGQEVVDLGTLVLNLSGQVIEGVEIRAEKSETIFKLDKKIFTVGKDLANRGGSAEEILDNVPSVTVDIDGNVNLRGSSNVRILINGQPSTLINNGSLNGLKSIQANSIDRIEVITNPSAKYEAEGMAGIINIILKKEQRKGFNGAFSVGVGIPWQYNAGAQVNYRKNKTNFFVNVSSGLRVTPGLTKEYSRQLIDDYYRISNLNSDRDRRGNNNSIRGGLDYSIDDNQTLTFSGSLRVSDNNNTTTVSYLDSLEQNGTIDFLRNLDRVDNELEEGTNQEYSLKYINDFGKKKQELTALIRYDQGGDNERSSISQSINNDIVQNFQQVDILESQSNKLGQIDFTKELENDFRIETGLRTNLRIISNDYEVRQNIDNALVLIDSLTDDFKYNEDIYAAYGTLSKSWNDKLSIQLGLRIEQTLISNEFQNNTELDTAYNYLKAFPSAFFTYNFNEKNAVQLSYSRRIQRPRFWYLNPFLTLSDDRNRFQGNPKLLPEYTDSYELGYIRYLEKGSLSSSLFYKFTTDVIQRIRTINTDGSNTSFPINLSEEISYGLDITANYDVSKWLRVDGNLTFFNYNLAADNLENAFDATDVSWFGRVGVRAKFLKNGALQTRFNYRAPRENIQGLRKAIYTVDFGLSKDFLNNNLTATISSRDLFNSRKRAYIIDLEPTYYAEGESQWRGRTIKLDLSYRINQKKKRGGGRSGGDYEGEEGGF